MAKMGYVKGQALGAHGQGLTAPIEVEQRQNRPGLGSATHVLRDLADGIPDTPWFHNEDGPDPSRWLMEGMDPHSPLSDKVLATWEIVCARSLKAISMSKFCRTKILVQLQHLRREVLPEVLDNLSGRPGGAATAASVLASDAVVAHYGRETAFHNVRDAMCMAQLDAMFSIVASARSSAASEGDRLLFAATSDSAAGLAEYVAWVTEGSGIGCILTASPEDCAVPNAHAIAFDAAESEVSALPQALQAARDHLGREGAHVVLGSVQADLATEVAGMGRGHVEGFLSRSLLVQTMAALQLVRPGGHLVLRVSDTFTRFTGALLYIVYRSFRRFRITKPFMSSPLTSERFVVGMDAKEPNSGVLFHLMCVAKRMDALKGGEDDILSFIHMKHLLEARFLVHVTLVEERIAQRESAAITALHTALEQDDGTAAVQREAATSELARLGWATIALPSARERFRNGGSGESSGAAAADTIMAEEDGGTAVMHEGASLWHKGEVLFKDVRQDGGVVVFTGRLCVCLCLFVCLCVCVCVYERG